MQQQVLDKDFTTQRKPTLGFLGLGWIGINRMQALIDEDCATVQSIAEPNEENAQQALKCTLDATRAIDLDDLINDPEIDGVVIATPSALHAEQSIQALRNGKAVFCQKPLGRTAREVKAVVQASQEADKLLGVDLSYRYTKAVQAIYPIISQGDLGTIFSVNLTFHNAYGPDKPWFYNIHQSGGGCIMDLGIHLIDLAMWCLNFPQIETLHSILFHQGEKLSMFNHQVEDYASVSMMTNTGININIQCSWNLSAGKDAEIAAFFYGTKAGAGFRNLNGSFFDFVAQKYEGTKTTTLVSPPDAWGGRATIDWARKLSQQTGYDHQSAREYITTAEIIDRIYGR